MEDICDTMKSIIYSGYVTMKGPFERIYNSSKRFDRLSKHTSGKASPNPLMSFDAFQH